MVNSNEIRRELVSIIIPVYRVEKYIDRCLKSIVGQTYSNIEIIIIDDGSQDKCPQICEEWAEKDRRIKVIHKDNQGLGMARNTGIDNAKGEFVCFVDSDDWIESNLVEKALNIAIKENADLVCYGFFNNDSKGNVVSVMSPSEKLVRFENTDVQKYFLPDYLAAKKQSIISPIMSACSCLIRKSIIDDSKWRFVSEREIISEDIYSLLNLCRYVRVSCVMPDSFYHYCFNNESLTHSYREDRFSKIKIFYNRCIDLCDRNGYSPEVKDRVKKPFINNVCADMKLIVKAVMTKNEKKTALRLICYDELLQNVIRTISSDFFNWKTRILWKAVEMKQIWLVYLLVSIKG